MFRLVSVLVLVATLWPAVAQAAYVTPTSRSTGFVVTAARWNQDVVDNMIAVRTAVLDSVVNETPATDMTITATGDEIIFADMIKLVDDSSDPTNERDVSYDGTDGVIQAKYNSGRVSIPGVFYRTTGASSAVTSTGDQDFSNTTTGSFAAKAGNIIEFCFFGTHTTDASPANVIFKFKKGSTTVVDSTAMTAIASVTTQSWHVHGTVLLTSTTAAEGEISAFLNAAAFSDRRFAFDDTPASVAVSASAEAWKLSINMDASGDSYTCRGGWVRIQ